MAPPLCFCGRAITDYDDGSIYCSTSCARLDSMSALCAQEALETSPHNRIVKQVFRIGRKEAIAKSSHYRRVEREGKKLAGRGIEHVRQRKRDEHAQASKVIIGPSSAEVHHIVAKGKAQVRPLVATVKQQQLRRVPPREDLRGQVSVEEDGDEDDDDRYGQDDSELYADWYSSGAGKSDRLDDAEDAVGYGSGSGAVLHSYFSSSTLASQLSSVSFSPGPSLSLSSSFSSGLSLGDFSDSDSSSLTPSTSTTSLASSASGSSAFLSASLAPALTPGDMADKAPPASATASALRKELPSSPFLDSIFTPIMIQQEAFHSDLFSSSFFRMNDKTSQPDETPRLSELGFGRSFGR